MRRANYVHQPLKEVDLPNAETAGDEARPRPAAASCWCDAVEDDADGDRPGEAPAGYRQQATVGTLDRLDLQLRADGELWPAGTLRLTSHGLATRVPAGRSCAAALDALGPYLKVPLHTWLAGVSALGTPRRSRAHLGLRLPCLQNPRSQSSLKPGLTAVRASGQGTGEGHQPICVCALCVGPGLYYSLGLVKDQLRVLEG